MNKLFRPLFALLLLIPVALILVLQTIAAPQADEDQGIDRRRRLLEQQAERLERAVENAIESDAPEAIQVRRNLHNQLKAIHLKLDELALFSNADDRERDEEHRRRGDDNNDRERDEERRRHDDDDHDREREKHLRAALEHLQGAGLSREAARHAIGEALRMQESHEHRDRDHRREDRHDHEHGDHDHEHGDHDKDDKRGRDKDEERRYHDDDDDEEDHLRVHHQTATQLEALRREVEELRQLIKRMAARR
ncbi:MAG: hypothetical protein VX644_16595 [Planctomycetota bacterium]|nr:hypothetical protein [Planctomycetota bacterium]